MGQYNSKVILCRNIKIEKGYKHVLNYSEQQMLALCLANKVVEKNDYSFIRSERNYIQVDISYNDALKCNYMCFQNPDYSNKWFFAFVDNIEYVNDNCVRIRYTIDEFSTWYDYWTARSCFVVREHTNNDAIGANLIDEGLETGEYIVNNTDYYSGLDNLAYILLATEAFNEPEPPLLTDFATNFSGIYSTGVAYWGLAIDNMCAICQLFADAGKTDAIYAMYMIPRNLLVIPDETDPRLPNQLAVRELEYAVTTNTTIDGYTPKNNKLKCFPYQYLVMNNNNGVSNVLHYEKFSNGCRFRIKGVPCIGGSIKCLPLNYDNNLENENEGIMAGKFPTLNWSKDEYVNWLTQNGVNVMGIELNAYEMATTSAGIQTGVGIAQAALGLPGGAENIGSGIGNLFGAVVSNYRRSLIPPTARGNVNGGDVNVCTHKNGFFFYHMSIRSEYARVIDDWFTSFGYKTNRIKMPNITGRQYFNFVQIGANENIGYSNNNERNVPAASMEIINTIFRNGVTIWHDHQYLGDYTVNNTIVSQ